MKPDFRTGLGYDVHRFARNRTLVLGGVIIPFEMGLEGHSDADVLLHALADALLGAAALGDIGQHFPNSDESLKGAKSTLILAAVFEMVVKKGYLVGNVDAVIIAEEPKMSPHIPVMKEKISRILLIPEEAISIKATTNETMGFVGRKEGIAALANVLIYRDHGAVASDHQ
jgi:2-C-methyl-D-erythritol 2,4-cyclodiphosphate synthase